MSEKERAMSDFDLPPEAVEAGARAAFEFAESQFTRPKTWDELHPRVHEAWRETASITLTAAGPLIERAVRERVAEEIEAAKDSNTFRNAVLDRAASIARGEESR